MSRRPQTEIPSHETDNLFERLMSFVTPHWVRSCYHTVIHNRSKALPKLRTKNQLMISDNSDKLFYYYCLHFLRGILLTYLNKGSAGLLLSTKFIQQWKQGLKPRPKTIVLKLLWVTLHHNVQSSNSIHEHYGPLYSSDTQISQTSLRKPVSNLSKMYPRATSNIYFN